MTHRTKCANTLDVVENISYQEGVVTHVDYEKDTADFVSGGITYKEVPVFYNHPDAKKEQRNGSLNGSSKAFCRGDEIIIRMFRNEPSHIIGFISSLWPCIKVPAFVFTGANPYAYDEHTGGYEKIESTLFYERYKTLTLGTCYASFTTYVNQQNADISTGFVSAQTHWTDSKYHRESKFYYNGESIYNTYNNETFSNVFNGTRSNILGAYTHPDNGWGALIYQVNTFYDWKPRVSGRVKFDFYIYTSTGTHTKLATAEADVTGASVQATGSIVYSPAIYKANDDFTGEIFAGSLKIYDACTFSSD
ncbi:MAG: hypothetical protein C0602_12770 [Denitrovibrio sp.]|nr:MAG: hypothetical protein C0602_12770 [Denitrovibrio sp.]